MTEVFTQDGHRLLGYKILCGHVWAWEYCPHVSVLAYDWSRVFTWPCYWPLIGLCCM